MNLKLSKQSKLILLSLLGVALLGGVSYGGYTYWQSRKVAPEPQEQLVEKPAEEKAYEIIDNPDGSHTFICYKFGFKFSYPRNWEFSESRSDLRGATGSDKTGTVEIMRGGISSDFFEIITVSPRDKTKYPTLKDLIEFLREGRDTPNQPNDSVSGVPGYRYFLKGINTIDALEITFENEKHLFRMYFPWAYRDDPDYEKIINSFEFL